MQKHILFYSFCLEIISLFFRFAHRKRFATKSAVFEDISEKFFFFYLGHHNRNAVVVCCDVFKMFDAVYVVHNATVMLFDIIVNCVLNIFYCLCAEAVDCKFILAVFIECDNFFLARKRTLHIRHEIAPTPKTKR